MMCMRYKEEVEKKVNFEINKNEIFCTYIFRVREEKILRAVTIRSCIKSCLESISDLLNLKLRRRRFNFR